MKIQLNTFSLMTLMILWSLLNSSCKKNFLDAIPDKHLVVPQNLKDFDDLLNNSSLVSNANELLVSSDDVLTSYTDVIFPTFTVTTKDQYIWSKTIENNSSGSAWISQYKLVFTSNVVLEGLAKYQFETTEQARWNLLKGKALFYRAWALYDLIQCYTSQYNEITASKDLGIPLRLKPDISLINQRNNLQECYDKVIKDVLESASLLPTLPSDTYTTPGKVSAYAFLARIHLSMKRYIDAGYYADMALKINSDLLDYKQLIATIALPFPQVNVEKLFHARITVNALTSSTNFFVDPYLYNSYSTNDMRKSMYFLFKSVDRYNFKGSYLGIVKTPFTGLAVDEMYLIRAESYARNGNTDLAMKDLNTLLIKRWNNTFIPLSASTALGALNIILEERRKSLVFRGLRWSDLKRLNTESQYAKTLTRLFGSETYTLPPNDLRYVMPIPDDEISLSGIIQNTR